MSSSSKAKVHSQKKGRSSNGDTNRVWDDLNEFYQNLASYMVIPGAILPFLRNQELVAKIEDKEKLLNLASILNRDVGQYATQLKGIVSSHNGRQGGSKDPNDLMAAIQIQEQYINWAFSYESVVIPTVEDLLGMFASIGVEVDSLRLPPPSSLVENVNQE